MEKKKGNIWTYIVKDFVKHRVLYLMSLPVVIYLFIFNYMPMYGIIIAFKNFKPRLGILGSPTVGFKYFQEFFSSIYFGRTFGNTLILSGLNLAFGFVAPIIFAILLNEVTHIKFKKAIQTITYLPHFITTVVICGIIMTFTSSDGIITQIVNSITGHTGSLIGDKDYFRAIYTISGIWQSFGWGSIIYLAAISGINGEIYEAAKIDGANKWQQIRNVTVPGIMTTIMVMFILAIGGFMNIGWEKAFLLQSPLTYETSDIISTFVYRKGFEDMNYSYSAAVGLFNSVINLVLLVGANKLSRKLNNTGIW